MNWLKKLFYQKKTIEETASWIEEGKQNREQEQQKIIEKLGEEFPGLLQATKEAMKALENAELQNPDIPDRAKHYLVGNTEQLLKITERFIENLIVPKNPADISQLDVLFHEYAKNSSRAASIVSEFLGENVKAIRKSIAEIEVKLHEIKQSYSISEETQKVQELIDKIKEVDELRAEIEKQQYQMNQELEQLGIKQENLRKEKETFTTRPAYLKIKEDLVNSAKARQEAEQAITELFHPIREVLKKYAHKMKNDKLAKYAEDPLSELIKDYSLGILKHVVDIRNSIEKDLIQLQPDKKHKAMEVLNILTKEKLSPMVHDYANSKKKEADIHHEVAERPIMQEYDQYAKDLKEIKEKIGALKQTIEKIQLPTNDELKEELRHELEKHKITLVL